MRRGGDAIVWVERSGGFHNCITAFIAKTEWRPKHKAAAGNCGTKLRPPYSAKAQAKWSTIFLPERNGGFTEKGAGGATGKMPFSVRGMARFYYLWNVIYLINNVIQIRAVPLEWPFFVVTRRASKRYEIQIRISSLPSPEQLYITSNLLYSPHSC